MKLYTITARFNSARKDYTFQSTLNVRPGDEVIVKPGPGYAVATVTHTEERSKPDPTLAWVVSRIETTTHEKNLRKLRKMAKTVA